MFYNITILELKEEEMPVGRKSIQPRFMVHLIMVGFKRNTHMLFPRTHGDLVKLIVLMRMLKEHIMQN